ncbi:MAG: 4Fe-4S binding protein [Bacillota bacterium]|nr:4Fe-4S binding protein [Bacillota bacterium]
MDAKFININHDICAGCSLCIMACSWRQVKCLQPDKAFIHLQKDKKRNRFDIIIDHENCDLCMHCVRECPTGALTRGDN